MSAERGAKAPAERLFDTWMEWQNAEDAMMEHLDRIFGDEGWGADDFSHDHYDSSLELRGCANEQRATYEQLVEVWKLGFQRMWINHVDGFETYYSAAGTEQLGTAYRGDHHLGGRAIIAAREAAAAAGAPGPRPTPPEGE